MQQTQDAYAAQDVDSNIYRSHAESSIELEASSRNSCRLCTLLLQSMSSTALEIFHKIENRLNEFNKPTTIYILISYNEQFGDSWRPCLFVCCPGKCSGMYAPCGDLLYALPVLDDDMYWILAGCHIWF